VQPRKYRLRFLDGGPTRFYEFVLEYNGRLQELQYIANDGNLLPAPLSTTSVRLGVAERADVVVDFSRFPLGSRLHLRNRLEQKNARGPTGTILNPGEAVIRFEVVKPLAAPDTSRVPSTLRPLEPLAGIIAAATVNRQFRFKRDNGLWVVNNQLFDVTTPMIRPRRGSTEIWELESNGNWSHPVHIHFEEGRIISRNGRPPPPHEQGRKDVYVLPPDSKLKLVIRFRDFLGKYPTHCHNLVHEDHAMMFRWDIVP
jgi:FtsP/CotA-like multicopper oxidase with cupredoxin domain